VDLSKDVFEIDKVLKGIVPVGDNQCRFDYNKLESAIQAVVKKKLKTKDSNIPMADTAEQAIVVPTFVVATKGLNAGGTPTLFRSYQCEGHNADKCYIWQAARATSAAPTFFKPTTIDIPPPKATYVDGGLQNNNPAQLAISEARKIWTKTKQFTVVSVGTGRLKAVRITDQANFSSKGSRKVRVLSWIPYATTASRIPAGLQNVKKMAQACVDLVTNSEPAHQRLLEESTSTDPTKQFPYYRFNVERDMQDIGLEEWNKVEEMNTHTKVYMEERERVLVKNECVRALMTPPVMECK
jgi:patatin-like phospholipase/acyl hydrolase